MTLIGSSHAHPCRLCGASGCACGGPTSTPGIDPLNPKEALVSNQGEPVHEYDVTANGYDTIMNLTEKDAERLYPGAKKRSGAAAPDVQASREKAETAGSKARTAPNK